MPRTIRSPAKFTSCLDRLNEDPSIRAMCRREQITPASWYSWIAQSEAGELPELYYFAYADVSAWLWEHAERAYINSISTIEAEFRSSGAVGQWISPIYFSGKIVYEEDPELAALGLKFCQEVLGLEDMDRREVSPKTGRLEKIPAKQWVPPRVDAVTKILSSHSAEYADKRSVDVNLNGSLGVTVAPLGIPKPPAQLQIIEQIVVEQITDATEREPVEVVAEPEPEPVVVEQPEPSSALSLEERALLEKLRSPRADIRAMAEQALDRLRNPPE